MPALDLTLLLPVLSLALLAGWGLTAWLLMRRSSALQEQLAEVQAQLGEAQITAQQAQLELHQQGSERGAQLTRIEHLQESLAELREQQKLLQSRLSEQQAQQQHWQLQAERAQTLGAEQGRQLDELRSERQRLQGRLDAVQSEYEDLKVRHSTLESSLEQRQQHFAEQQQLLKDSREQLKMEFEQLAGKIFEEREQRFAETSHERLGQLLDPLRERIQSFEKRVEESYQNEARERFSLAKELERLQQLNQRLGDEATNLTRALQGQKTQGNWGELILERVLEHAGLEKGREYHTQVSLKSADGERFQPDVLIQLPGDKQVVVDAKVSLTAYQAMISAEDEGSRVLALKQHVQSLRNHLKGLSLKDYQRLEGLQSLDFVLLFVPIEAAFAAAPDARVRHVRSLTELMSRI